MLGWRFAVRRCSLKDQVFLTKFMVLLASERAWSRHMGRATGRKHGKAGHHEEK